MTKKGKRHFVPIETKGRNIKRPAVLARRGSSDYRANWLVIGLGTIVVLAGNLGLKYLELQNLHRHGLSQYFINFFNITPEMLATPWKLLLPYAVSPPFMRWSTTGLIPVSLLNQSLGVEPTFLLLNSLLITITVLCAWFATRSRVFTLTMAVCIGFGTQFNHAYPNTSVFILYLFIIYLEVNLLFLYRICVGKGDPFINKTLFVVSLMAAALCWEMWIDYFAFIFIFALAAYIAFTRRSDKKMSSRFAFVLISATCIVAVYMSIKVLYSSGLSEHFTRGLEGESIFNYMLTNNSPAYAIMAAEDIFSNYVTYNYLALTNFLPPFCFTANALIFGREAIVNNQFGYATSYGSADFVYYHNIFLWYFCAGAVLLAFLYFLARYLVRFFKDTSLRALALPGILLLIAVGSFTHLFIKYRFYISLPVYSYKCIVSILGVSLLIAYLIVALRDKMSNRKLNAVIMVLTWVVIILGAVLRPVLHSYLASLMKMPIYPLALEEITGMDLQKLYWSLVAP